MGIAKHSEGSLEAKALRQKIGDETLLRPFFALIEDDGTRPELVDDLATGAAGRAWNAVIAIRRGDHGNGLNLKFWAVFSDGRKNCGTLGAVRHSVRRILDVAARKDSAF